MPELRPELTLDTDTAFYILLKTREFDAKSEATDPDAGSNPTDDKGIDILEFQPGDAVETELAAAIGDLNEDEKLDLIALIWIGRGDFDFDQWAEARDSAREVPPPLVRYVLALPLVSDYLEKSLSDLGHSLNDYLDTRVRTLPPESGTE